MSKEPKQLGPKTQGQSKNCSANLLGEQKILSYWKRNKNEKSSLVRTHDMDGGLIGKPPLVKHELVLCGWNTACCLDAPTTPNQEDPNRKSLSLFTYHVGTGAGKGHELGVELQTGNWTRVFTIQYCYFYTTLSIPDMDFAIF